MRAHVPVCNTGSSSRSREKLYQSPSKRRLFDAQEINEGEGRGGCHDVVEQQEKVKDHFLLIDSCETPSAHRREGSKTLTGNRTPKRIQHAWWRLSCPTAEYVPETGVATRPPNIFILPPHSSHLIPVIHRHVPYTHRILRDRSPVRSRVRAVLAWGHRRAVHKRPGSVHMPMMVQRSDGPVRHRVRPRSARRVAAIGTAGTVP